MVQRPSVPYVQYGKKKPGSFGSGGQGQFVSREPRVMGWFYVDYAPNNVFVTLRFALNGQMYQLGATLNQHETKKGQKMSTQMLASMVQKFFASVKMKAQDLKLRQLDVHFVCKGDVWVRQPILVAVAKQGVKVVSVVEADNVAHNGVRPKASRRI